MIGHETKQLTDLKDYNLGLLLIIVVPSHSFIELQHLNLRNRWDDDAVQESRGRTQRKPFL